MEHVPIVQPVYRPNTANHPKYQDKMYLQLKQKIEIKNGHDTSVYDI